MNPFLIPSASTSAGRLRPFHYPSFDSDGLVAERRSVSGELQLFPRIAGDHPVHGELDAAAGSTRAGGYYQTLDDVDHIDIVALPPLDKIGWQKRFIPACSPGWRTSTSATRARSPKFRRPRGPRSHWPGKHR